MSQRTFVRDIGLIAVLFALIGLFTILSPLLRGKTDPRAYQQPEQQTASMDQTTQPAKLIIDTTKEGTGETAKNGDVVSVHYTGKLTDGTVFDSSIPRGKAFSFELGRGQVIAGWEQGILGMKVGEHRALTIPPHLGYGTRGAGGVIPPNATLQFEVELLGVTH